MSVAGYRFFPVLVRARSLPPQKSDDSYAHLTLGLGVSHTLAPSRGGLPA
jgi:hypothetical protein